MKYIDIVNQNIPALRFSVSFWGWIWVIWSGFSFSATSFLRFVTVLFSLTRTTPRGFSTLIIGQPFLTRASISSQRVDLDSPCFRKACRHKLFFYFIAYQCIKYRQTDVKTTSKNNFSFNFTYFIGAPPTLFSNLNAFTTGLCWSFRAIITIYQKNKKKINYKQNVFLFIYTPTSCIYQQIIKLVVLPLIQA